ncbi:orotidine-5'-phosphate decarboxylase [Pseudactinotalea sp. HY158]|uniref:orotidine-5'-phosphate decarboxylase n=1 Tax=unclassified Pseudactinotalea TaxID=2649176 RepID=UPI00128C23B6|nr:orotidine-5'-phosphate decarboxylase [Pseudactinotalea sp. HY158]MPV49332.1 orotidine-5'-phosphate decarboxylase [Pseudactinotalea sp. HY160]QGH70978.1 orotidine-5'-phosphate decarboxylase [Pseudactinotalea sp. HY158]
MAARGPLCVGVDPHPQLLAAWGLADDVAGLREFSLRVVEALGSRVAAIKPQVAFFERHGSAGMAVLEEVVAACAALDQLTILDAKRGDIGSTMAGYAHAYLHPDSPLAGDAVTLSPYLGFGSLAPAIELAREHGRGVFVLTLTSNPEGAEVQHARGADGASVAGAIAAAAGRLNAGSLGSRELPESLGSGESTGDPAGRLGDVGLVVGATLGPVAERLGIDLAAVAGPLLAPGLGAQGATAADLAAAFGPARSQVLANSSRAILAAGPEAGALRAAAARTTAELRAALA